MTRLIVTARLKFRERTAMPIYEYVCPGCDLKFEVFHRTAHNGEKTSCASCTLPNCDNCG